MCKMQQRLRAIQRQSSINGGSNSVPDRTPAIDKLLLVNGALTIYYTHRSPVTVTGPDAMALYEWLMTPNPAREWQQAYRAGMETTCKSAA